MAADLQTFRDAIKRVSVPWLQRGIAERLLYSIGIQVDVFGDALVAGAKQRFPNYYSNESLPLLGRERRIRRGRTETDASYATRLTRWLTDHQRRGGPLALLAQLYAYFAPNNFVIELVYNSGRRFTMDTAGNVTQDDIVWTPDALTTKWARWWLFYHTSMFGTPTAEQIKDLKVIPREWNAAHPLGYIVLFPTGTELWDFPPGHVWDESGTWDTAAPGAQIPVDD